MNKRANNIVRALDRYSQRITASKFIRTSKKKENELEWVKEILTELKLIVDSTATL
ncbi:MAG: hypothetical protein WBA93_02605 [Microcoleaceae cyanobacterium]